LAVLHRRPGLGPGRQRPRPRLSEDTHKPATAASAESANVTEVAEAPSIMAETANPITGRAIAGDALGDEARHTVILTG
jgi:hypothetical protein